MSRPTKAAALFQFFSEFLTAYEESSVYDMEEPPEMPYLTYQLVTGAFDPDASGTSLTVNLWYRSESYVPINAKVEEISQAIGRHGVCLKCQGGRIIIRRNDANFAQTISDAADDKIKRKLINLNVEFYTND